MNISQHNQPILVLGGNGKTGRRVVERLVDYAREAAATGVWSRSPVPV
jgi:nucleoside-diphosphate-sugar epimerase